jgi:hypothetical protein
MFLSFCTVLLHYCWLAPSLSLSLSLSLSHTHTHTHTQLVAGAFAVSAIMV